MPVLLVRLLLSRTASGCQHSMLNAPKRFISKFDRTIRSLPLAVLHCGAPRWLTGSAYCGGGGVGSGFSTSASSFCRD